MMVHEDYKEMLAAQALSALDAADARSLAAHLQSCADCRSELSEWEETAALLAFDAAPVEPSTRVREQIVAAISAEGRPGANTEKAADSQQNPPGPKRRVDSDVLPFVRPQKSAWSSLGSFGAIAAALAFVTLIGSLILLWQQNRMAQREIASLSARMEETKTQLAREREAVALLTSPGARMTELAGTKMAPGAHAMLAYSKTGHAMLMAKGLPAAPKGMAYQLWFIVGSKPMPGKVFKAASSGEGVLEDDLPAEAMNNAVFAITLEPESGVQAPTGAIYLQSAG